MIKEAKYIQIFKDRFQSKTHGLDGMVDHGSARLDFMGFSNVVIYDSTYDLVKCLMGDIDGNPSNNHIRY